MAIGKIKQRLKVIKEFVIIQSLKLFGYTYKGQRNKPIVFILSTGRCGSTSIQKLFNQHPKFIAFHEDMPALIELSTQLAENPNQQKEIYAKLNDIFADRIWEGKRGQVLVHSDHRLWNLVPYLSNYFKEAFFIHLIRNPSESVKSYLQRDWYSSSSKVASTSKFEKHRLHGNLVHDMSEDAWDTLNQTGKCLWYWNFINTAIDRDLKVLDEKHWNVIKLERFVDDINTVVKTKFELDSNFLFENEITNRSKTELNSDILLNEIEMTIELHKENLFLKYYQKL